MWKRVGEPEPLARPRAGWRIDLVDDASGSSRELTVELQMGASYSRGRLLEYVAGLAQRAEPPRRVEVTPDARLVEVE